MLHLTLTWLTPEYQIVFIIENCRFFCPGMLNVFMSREREEERVFRSSLFENRLSPSTVGSCGQQYGTSLCLEEEEEKKKLTFYKYLRYKYYIV